MFDISNWPASSLGSEHLGRVKQSFSPEVFRKGKKAEFKLKAEHPDRVTITKRTTHPKLVEWAYFQVFLLHKWVVALNSSRKTRERDLCQWFWNQSKQATLQRHHDLPEIKRRSRLSHLRDSSSFEYWCLVCESWLSISTNTWKACVIPSHDWSSSGH